MIAQVNTGELNRISLNSAMLNSVDIGERNSVNSDKLREPDVRFLTYGYDNENPPSEIRDANGGDTVLKLNNFAFSLQSGFGAWSDDYSKWIAANGAVIENTSKTKFTLKKTSTIANAWSFRSNLIISSNSYWKIKIKVTGISPDTPITLLVYGGEQKEITQDGIYDLNLKNDTTNSLNYGIVSSKVWDNGNVTIEQIPEYKDALFFDGVDDYCQINCNPNKYFKSILMDIQYPNNMNGFIYTQGNFVDKLFSINISGGIAYKVYNSGDTYINGALNTSLTTSDMNDIKHIVGISVNNTAPINGVPLIGSLGGTTYPAKFALWQFEGYYEELTPEEQQLAYERMLKRREQYEK